MIREVDDALRALVRERALPDADVEVVLDAPTTDWAARRNAPTVNLFLYDIREDLRWRERGAWAQRGPDGVVVGRVPVPRLFKLSYLVTAWTQRPEDEHRLLDTVLLALLRHDFVPSELITGALAGTRYKVAMSVGLPPPEDRGFADVWSSLGGQLKPSIDVVVTAPAVLDVVQEVGPPVREHTVIQMASTTTGAEEQRTLHVPPAPSATAVSRTRRNGVPGAGGSGTGGEGSSDGTSRAAGKAGDDGKVRSGAAEKASSDGAGKRKPRARKPR